MRATASSSACPGYVKKVTSASVHVSLDDLNYASDVPVPPRTLTKLSRAPEMALEEAIELEVDDELVKAVDRVLGDVLACRKDRRASSLQRRSGFGRH
jgi:hypothetical protein